MADPQAEWQTDRRGASFWDRVEPGHTTVLIGGAGRVPGAPRLTWVVRVRCDGPHRPLGPVLEARDRVAQLMGRPPIDLAAGRLRRGIRRHLLGDDGEGEREAELLGDLDRLGEAGSGLCALVFESVELADPATLSLLTRLVRRPLRPALVLGLRGEPSRGPVRELLDAVLGVEGEGRVIRAPSAGDEPERALVDLSSLSGPVRQTLRAASVIGDGFESGLVARLLGMPEREVLLRLQEASDAGVIVDDLGDGRFRLDPGEAELLRQSLLPSLSAAWHRELAQILSGEEPVAAATPEPPPRPRPVAPSAPPPAPAAEDDAPPPIVLTPPSRADLLPDDGGVVLQTSAPPVVEKDEPASDPFAALAPAAGEAPAPPPPAKSARIAVRPAPEPEEEADPFARLAPPSAEVEEASPPAPPPPAEDEEAADPFSALGPTPEPASEPAPAPEPVAGPWRSPRPVPEPEPIFRDPAALRARIRGPEQVGRARRPGVVPGRAAQHLAAAGDPEAAIPRFVRAAREAIADGASGTAEAYLERALALSTLLPETPARRALRARAHVELARVHWEGSGPRGFTLSLALAEAEQALGLVQEGEEPELRAEIRAMIAAICYDIGDAPSLERALSELTGASRELLAAGRARVAARLLNDQAAVWVRLGDPVRATHLLQESRRVFASLGDPSAEERLELAETEHLLARLPLHVAARPGMEEQALAVAVAHAEQAAQVYEEAGDRRELARVWETLGRLERRRGALQRAWRHLTMAVEVQRAVGDATGLARSAGALAEVLASAGRPEDALRALADSIQMNAIKGSPAGLASNREALAALAGALPAERRARLAGQIQALEAALHEAEGSVGARAT